MGNEKTLYILLSVCLLFSFLSTCSSCRNKRQIEASIAAVEQKIDETFFNKEEMRLEMEIRGLEDEERTVLNINQIYLTKKRPDERVIEIEKELAVKRKQLSDIQKKKAVVNEKE